MNSPLEERNFALIACRASAREKQKVRFTVAIFHRRSAPEALLVHVGDRPPAMTGVRSIHHPKWIDRSQSTRTQHRSSWCSISSES